MASPRVGQPCRIYSSKLIIVILTTVLMTYTVESETIDIAYFARNTAPWGPDITRLNTGAAIKMAEDFVNSNNTLLPNDTINIIDVDDACSEKVSLEAAVNMTLYRNAHAFIGPTCAAACITVGLVASQWNIPTLGYFCGNSDMSNKARFDTFMRTVQPIGKSGDVVTDVLMHFNWTNIGIMRGKNALGTMVGHNEMQYQGMLQFSDEKNITVLGTWDMPNPHATNSLVQFAEEMEVAVREASENSRSK